MSTIEEGGTDGVTENVLDVLTDETASAEKHVVNAGIIEQITQPFFDLCNWVVDWVYPVNPVTESREFWYIPKWGENLLGKVMYPVMCLKEGGAIDHLYSQKVQEITKNLAQNSKRELDYEVTILRDNVVNAWCLPGGKMAVYNLLLEKIDYYIHNKEALGLKGYTDPSTGSFISYEGLKVDDVLAALLGHEMTHADARHAARKLEFSFLAQALVFGLSTWGATKLTNWEIDLKKREVTEAGNPNILQEKESLESWKKVHLFAFSWITQLAIQLYFFFGSRCHELEADKYGTELAAKSGYNPAGALFLQEILKKESHGFHDLLPEFLQDIKEAFSTHPSCQERQEEIYPVVRDWQQIYLTR